jgi:hypothetical protein
MVCLGPEAFNDGTAVLGRCQESVYRQPLRLSALDSHLSKRFLQEPGLRRM